MPINNCNIDIIYQLSFAHFNTPNIDAIHDSLQ